MNEEIPNPPKQRDRLAALRPPPPSQERIAQLEQEIRILKTKLHEALEKITQLELELQRRPPRIGLEK